MKNYRWLLCGTCMKSLLVLTLILLAGSRVWAQSETCPVPVPPSQVPANPLLVGHTNFFCPVKIYDLRNDAKSKPHVPTGLRYAAYSAVGYDLANSIMLEGPGGVVIVDLLGEEDSAKTVIKLFKAITHSVGGSLPVKALIYTHNHIDHIGAFTG